MFILGTLAFWLLLVAVSILIIALDSIEKEGASFFTLAVFIGIVGVYNPTLVAAVRHSPLLLIYGLLAYLALGMITAIVKWYFFLLNVRDAVKEGGKPEEVWTKGKCLEVRGKYVKYPIKVSNFKARIIGWMTYWPWVAVWTLLDDPIRRLFQRLYSTIAGQLQKMADNILNQPPTQ